MLEVLKRGNGMPVINTPYQERGMRSGRALGCKALGV